jgi:hypothetical protein
MKNNTNDVKNYLRQALMSVPDDFNLQDVKSHINKALSVVESVEKKRLVREQNVQKRKSIVLNKNDMSKTINIIDQQLNAEKIKLEEIKNKKKVNWQDEDSELQNVFG